MFSELRYLQTHCYYKGPEWQAVVDELSLTILFINSRLLFDKMRYICFVKLEAMLNRFNTIKVVYEKPDR